MYLGFERGKGISCLLGILLAGGLFLPLAVASVAWCIVMYFSKKVSLASIVAVITLPITDGLSTGNVQITNLICILAIIIILRHGENIDRLLDRNEPSTYLWGKPASSN